MAVVLCVCGVCVGVVVVVVVVVCEWVGGCLAVCAAR